MKNLKNLFFAVAIFISVSSNAEGLPQVSPQVSSLAFPQTLSLYETSTQFGFCSGADYTFCSMNLTRTANSTALNQGVNDCSFRGGHAAPFGNCNSQCFPFFLPYNAPMQSVNCNSQCYLDCQIP